MEILFYILAGLAAGVLGGMGMGGGTVLIPILTIFLGITQQNAQGINLIAFIPMAIIAIVLHAKNKLINFKVLLFLILPGAAATTGGVFLAKAIEGDLLQKLFGGFLIALAIFQIIFTFISKAKHERKCIVKYALRPKLTKLRVSMYASAGSLPAIARMRCAYFIAKFCNPKEVFKNEKKTALRKPAAKN